MVEFQFDFSCRFAPGSVDGPLITYTPPNPATVVVLAVWNVQVAGQMAPVGDPDGSVFVLRLRVAAGTPDEYVVEREFPLVDGSFATQLTLQVPIGPAGWAHVDVYVNSSGLARQTVAAAATPPEFLIAPIRPSDPPVVPTRI